MKTRARKRHPVKESPPAAREHQTRAANRLQPSAAVTEGHSHSHSHSHNHNHSRSSSRAFALTSAESMLVTPSLAHPCNVPSTSSSLAHVPSAPGISDTPSATGLVTTHSQPLVHATGLGLGSVMSERQSPSQHNPESASSPAALAASAQHVQDVAYSDQDRQTSPVQLTELLCCAASSSGCDKNHNLPSFVHATSAQSLHCFASDYGSMEPPHRLTSGFSDSSVAGNANFSASHYYHDLDEGEKVEVPSSSHYSVSLVPCFYPKEGLYLSQNKDSTPYKDNLYLSQTFDSQACRAFSFCSVDAGREYSPPEVTTYSSGSSTCYTSPLTSSVTSSGSPDSAHWNPDSGHILPLSLYLPKAAPAHSTLPEGSGADSGKRGSDPQPTAHIDYYSGQSGSVEEDSMQDIKQDILTSDIHKHIYENFAHHLPLSPMDDQEDSEEHSDHAEILSPGRRGSGGKAGGSSGKKRRRRTQTPGQRKAANLRERKRMCYLNRSFNSLKDRLPNVRSRKKLSRIQTLKAAIFYIGLLSECLQSS